MASSLLSRASGALLLLGAFGCSDGDSSSSTAAAPASSAPTVTITPFAREYCKRMADCGKPDPSCEAEASVIVFRPGCEDVLRNASCPDLIADAAPASIADKCFPSCPAPKTATCNADGTLDECSKYGQIITVTCSGICQYNGLTWSGACGDTHDGRTSKTGSAVCWCQ